MKDHVVITRWLKWMLPPLALLQVGPCTVEAFRQNLENEVILSASSAACTVTETVFMNLMGM